MMLRSSLLSILCLILSIPVVALKPRGSPKTKIQALNPVPKDDSAMRIATLELRGGGGILSDNKEALILMNSLTCLVIGSAFVIAPHIASDLYDAPTKKHTLDNISVSGVGGLVLNWVITIHLAVNKLCSTEEAIAFGHLPLLMLVAKDWLTNEYKKADVGTTLLYTVSLIDLTLCTSILYGFWEPNKVAKILSVFLGIQGFIAWATPIFAGKALISRDLTGNAKSQAWFMTLGINRVSTSLLCGALAWGMDPIKAVGYGTLAFVVMAAETLFVRKGFDAMGGNWPIHHKFLLFQLSSIVYALLVK